MCLATSRASLRTSNGPFSLSALQAARARRTAFAAASTPRAAPRDRRRCSTRRLRRVRVVCAESARRHLELQRRASAGAPRASRAPGARCARFRIFVASEAR